MEAQVEIVLGAREKKRRIREQKRQKRRIEGAIFIEIILRKLWEYEQRELLGELWFPRLGERAVETAGRHTQREADGDNARYCFIAEGYLRERMAPTGDILDIALPAFNYAVSESYKELVRVTSMIAGIVGNPLYGISWRSMEKVYTEELTDEKICRVREQFEKLCCERLEDLSEEGDIYECLGMSYVYFSHANAWWAVRRNNEEGQRIAAACGLEWAGTTYYNAYFYYCCKRVQKQLCQAAEKLWGNMGAGAVGRDFYAQLPDLFAAWGGITYHSMWQWAQRQNNYPEDQYGFYALKTEPPRQFAYFYRNTEPEKKETLHELLERMKEYHSGEPYRRCQREGLAVAGRYYNNGGSYLADFEPAERLGGVSGEAYTVAVEFLRSFRTYRVSGCVECLFVAE